MKIIGNTRGQQAGDLDFEMKVLRKINEEQDDYVSICKISGNTSQQPGDHDFEMKVL